MVAASCEGLGGIYQERRLRPNSRFSPQINDIWDMDKVELSNKIKSNFHDYLSNIDLFSHVIFRSSTRWRTLKTFTCLKAGNGLVLMMTTLSIILSIYSCKVLKLQIVDKEIYISKTCFVAPKNLKTKSVYFILFF